jgi:hypothetical protein
MARSYALSRENIALELVEAYEKKKGGKPRRSLQGSGYDMNSRGRKIEIKTRRSVKGGFVQLGERQFRVLCKERNYWIYVVCISGRKTRIVEFRRSEILPKIRPYIHYDFFFGTKDLT